MYKRETTDVGNNKRYYDDIDMERIYRNETKKIEQL